MNGALPIIPCAAPAAVRKDLAGEFRDLMEFYDFTPTERRLLHRLARLSLDIGESRCFLDFMALGEWVNLDARKVRRALEDLERLLVVEWNRAENWAALRPDLVLWSAARGKRERPARAARKAGQAELGIRHERELEEMLTTASREVVHTVHKTAEEFSGGESHPAFRKIPPPPGNACAPPENIGENRAAENSAGTSLKALSEVQSVQASKLKALKGGGRPEWEPRDQGEFEFMGRIEALLGEAAAMNDGGKWRNRWRDPAQRGRAVRALSDVESKVREGKLLERPAGYLEDIFKRFWRRI